MQNILHIEPDSNVLIIGGQKYQLEPRVMAVLKTLLDGKGKVVRREYFLETIWDNRSGSDEALTQAISRLRKILKHARGISIKTQAKVGYQIIVEEAALAKRRGETEESPEHAELAHQGFFRRNEKLILALVAFLILAFSAFLFFPREIEEDLVVTKTGNHD